MRQIHKKAEPEALTRFRADYQGSPNFGYDLIDADLRTTLRKALVEEQRGLCAYTGRYIDHETCHIEHVKAQAHCEKGEDVAYNNLLGCVPAPLAPGLPYGAQEKKSWPDPTEQALFVSPLGLGCEDRFAFNLRGQIHSRHPGDAAAEETIKRLRLDHRLLDELRKAAIDSTLEIRGRGGASLDLRKARARLNQLLAAERDSGKLEPFCFALKQALERHIHRIEMIREGKRSQR